ncbi:inner membrane protein YhjD [Mycolicibacterium sp. P1-18]|uniref:inner membrane protein YhjD n=1 Tax=Mycolicibacterium sp. P1-18 TaxID=2024615 RepID=UPI001F5B4592|nr:inner membrane protein YhjD [Mycolicibacterium sp. P1-18]
MTETAEPGVLDRLRARYHWFDRVMRAQGRYDDSKGDFYAAGITYFTIFALFPLLMVAFAAGGFVLASRPDLLSVVEAKITGSVSGDLGQQLVELMKSAIASRTSVGVIGLATAAWAGLGWMANLREALSQMWGHQRGEPGGFVSTKVSDLLALLSAFVAIVLTVALSLLGNNTVMRGVVEFFGIPEFTGLGVLLRIASLVVSLGISWLLFTWIIARLPRERVTLRSAARAGLLAAVAFEVFKLVASVYLGAVIRGPAGATFGPVLGLMVFAYITARLILFATAWAATASENLAAAPVGPPDPAEIITRVEMHEGLGVRGALAAAGVGALGALGLSRLTRRR